jgi:disulfide oxidoreductase YuzD
MPLDVNWILDFYAVVFQMLFMCTSCVWIDRVTAGAIFLPHCTSVLDVVELKLGRWWSIQEFNIEKLQIVEAEKKKIRQEFERKEKQVEVRRKM